MSYALSVVKSLQRGTIALSSGATNTATGTISAVVMAKSLLIFGGSSGGQSSSTSTCKERVTLTNTTTVTATSEPRDSNTYGTVVDYEVVEYY
tara:strand:- start:278 stop:556 length:279 start_codon:yes stop_codon:yes gene_type:complete